MGVPWEGFARYRATFLRTPNFFQIFYFHFSKNKNFCVFSIGGMRLAKKQAKKNPWAIAPHKHKKILELLRAGVSIYEVSRVVGVGTNTVQRRKAIVDAELIGEISNDDGEQAIAFRVSRWRCPVHGWVEFDPCVICSSLAAMRPARGDGGTLGN